MADVSTLALAASRRLHDDLAGDRLPRATARLYSQHVRLQAGGEPLEAFGAEDAQRQLWNAVRLVDSARYARRRGEPNWSVGLRRAGELFEWLANPASNPEGLPFRLLGAAAYHVAGYPARAASLARAAPDEEDDIPLLRQLLGGDLNSLLITCSDLAAGLAGGEASASPSSETALDLVAQRVASALGVVAASLRWEPDDRLADALEILDLAPAAAMHFADPFAWLLMRLTADSAAMVAATSLRMALAPVRRALGDEGQAALEQYARAAFHNRQGLVWPSQQRGIDKLVEGESFALCTPTGSGKTRIAEIALLQGLLSDEGADAPLCLYIVPTRALAAEVEGKLARAIREVQRARAVTVTRLYGGIDWSPTDEWLADDQPTVLICTQEKAEALVRFFGRSLSNRLRVVIIDEAHAVQFSDRVSDLESHESRSLRLEMLVSRLKASQSDARFIAISAVAQRLARPLGRWISAEAQPEAITVPYRSTRQVIGRLVLRTNGDTRIIYDLLDGNPVTVGTDGEPPFVPRPFPRMPPAPGFEGVMKRSAAGALWAAASSVAAAEHERDGHSVLVSIAEQIGSHASWWLTLIEEMWQDDLPRFFVPPVASDDKAAYGTALASCADLFGERSREYRLLKHGVAVHHGRMPGRLTRYVGELIERRVVRITLATSTLSEGINLPFATVIVPGLKRYSDNSRMSGREFANLAGRAGRPGIATEGQTLAVIPSERPAVMRDYRGIVQEILGAGESEASARSAIARLLRHLRRIAPEADFERWLESTAPLDPSTRADDAQLRTLDSVDALIIAAIEDSDELEVEDALRAFWQATFAHYAETDEAELEAILLARGRAVAAHLFPEKERRSRIYRTSLPPRDAELLFGTAPVLIEHLQTGSEYRNWAPERRLQYVLRAMEILDVVPRFRVPANVGASAATREDALRWWFGVASDDARTPSIAQIAQWHDFLQREVRYRFTWGLGSAMAVATENTSSPEEAPVPTAALWIKDLLTWGTLDPVEAYVLARALADTRPAAAVRAEEYYDAVGSRANDPYELNHLRQWAASTISRPRFATVAAQYDAAVVERMSPKARDRDYRVVPRSVNGAVAWVDPSGALLAMSPTSFEFPDPRDHDFVLSPNDASVRATRYV